MENINFNHIYFIGIGGIGMSGIAEVLLGLGYQVSGSDLHETNVTKRLAKGGARIFLGQMPAHITFDVDLVVRSTAIKEGNVELSRAQEMGIPVIHRADMLAFLMLEKRAICVAGAHGKTTTSSMIALMLELAGMDPTIVVGGEISQIGSNAKYGKSDLLVAEADESDGSFLRLHPWMTVVTNIEADHLDHYSDLEEIKSVFGEFIEKPGQDGVGVFCIDCPEVKNLISRAPGEILTYGFDPEAQIHGTNWYQKGTDNFADVYQNGQLLGSLHLKVPGKHNISNGLAAVAVGLYLGLDFSVIAASLLEFSGAKRRFQVIGEVGEIKVVDDYAHHPTEVRATLQAARGSHQGRIIAVFQPHRYSRTKFLAHAFANCFTDADKIILTEVYSAGESLSEGAESECILALMSDELDVEVIPCEGLNNHLLQVVQPGDLVMMLGAGDIWKTSLKLVHDLQNK